MPIDTEKLEKIVFEWNSERNNYIDGLSEDEKISGLIQFDSTRPLTTNRIQLETIGVDCSNLEDNIEEVIQALALIGVKVMISENTKMDAVVATMKRAIEDQVHEIWRPDGMFEVIEI
jgi:hypothetical protein